MQIQCFQIPPKSTNQALVHLETPNGLQNLKAPPKLFKTPPRLQKRLKNLPKVQTCTSNKHETSRSLSMHISNQTIEDYDVDVRNIRNGVVDIRNNVVVKCCK